jgi:Stress responsive A/B Barrel Domain
MEKSIAEILANPNVPGEDKILYNSLLSKSLPGQVYHHLVLFKFTDVTEEEQKECMQACAALEFLCGGKEAGILSYRVEKNFDTRKSWYWAEIVEFRDLTAFILFHQHTEHKKFAAKLRQFGVGVRVEWAVFDYQ